MRFYEIFCAITGYRKGRILLILKLGLIMFASFAILVLLLSVVHYSAGLLR